MLQKSAQKGWVWALTIITTLAGWLDVYASAYVSPFELTFHTATRKADVPTQYFTAKPVASKSQGIQRQNRQNNFAKLLHLFILVWQTLRHVMKGSVRTPPKSSMSMKVFICNSRVNKCDANDISFDTAVASCTHASCITSLFTLIFPLITSVDNAKNCDDWQIMASKCRQLSLLRLLCCFFALWSLWFVDAFSCLHRACV